MTLMGVGSFFGLASRREGSESAPGVVMGVGVLFITLGVLQFVIGRWLQKLNPKARTPATVLSAIGLLGFPIGTLVNAYILYLLRSQKGEMVLSEYYQGVVAATPHIKYKTPVLVWICGILLVLLLVFGVIAAAAAK